ncbi:hypothetical protein LRS06_17100 [Hymenobacter sp. J193]|uniref:hypothetical protein n=1 Tax=Hymenobacter sp. J193 TaxID=2898429 RepID=UPI0021510D34|nr:hypothetical protein [Hymenobacter sp. J193]MCR5889456.1 hypothetical protein [Hymenobacter sp. J193]
MLLNGKHQMTYNFRGFTLIAIVGIVTCSCSGLSNKKEDLTGSWVKYKTINYMAGKETVIEPQSGVENGYVGSLENPNVVKFTKYSEIVFTGREGKPDRAYSYSFNGDSIVIDEGHFSPKAMSIDRLTKDSLELSFEMKVDYIDPSYRNGKWIMRDFYYKTE